MPHSPAQPSSPHPGELLPKDFSFLLRPEIYHALTPLNVPLAFRNSPKQPSPDTPIPELVARGFFRAAAIAAVQQLTSSSPPIDPKDYRRIFDLLYTRLACLTLIDATSLAAQEVKAFEDLNNASIYVDENTGEHLVPWDLRVLNVRLQALGFGDPRRAVMSYYELAREARENIARAAAKHEHSASELWKERLCDLGIKVAGALIEMDDLPGAAQHLTTVKGGDGKMAMSRALLWLHIGDTDAARRAIRGSDTEGSKAEKVIAALADMGDGDFAAALEKWGALKEDVDDEMVGLNMAVCLLYETKMDEVRTLVYVSTISQVTSDNFLGPSPSGEAR
jgi:hypothetical protein